MVVEAAAAALAACTSIPCRLVLVGLTFDAGSGQRVARNSWWTVLAARDDVRILRDAVAAVAYRSGGTVTSPLTLANCGRCNECINVKCLIIAHSLEKYGSIYEAYDRSSLNIRLFSASETGHS